WQPPPPATIATASQHSKVRIAREGITSCTMPRSMEKLTQEIVPILVLCAVIAFVVVRLPRVDVGHTSGFRHRRTLNWVPLGLTYAFLYMGRYNMTVLKNVHGISQRDFGNIDFWGSLVYGLSFLLNGPLCDRYGGRRTILVAAGGA